VVTVIINPVAGGRRPDAARKLAETASATLTAAGQDWEVLVTERRGHAGELARRARGRGARLVVAWGGDGTVNEVASELAFSDTPLAIVPSGSGNGLARELGVARQPRQALTEALTAAPRRIDAGELGGRLFFNVAGVGFDAHIASCFDRDAIHRGLAQYLRISLRELLAYEPAIYRIRHNGSAATREVVDHGNAGNVRGGESTSARRALLVTLANSSQFGNGACIAPGACLDDGKLDLVVFEEVSRLATFRALPRLFTGHVTRARGFSVEQVVQATIEGEREMTFHVDGEPVADGTVLQARVHPAALLVRVR
jgi:diacylglycerol kinase family enzyme